MSEYKKEEWRVKPPSRRYPRTGRAVLDQPDIGAYHREPGDHGARCGCVLSE